MDNVLDRSGIASVSAYVHNIVRFAAQ